MFWHSGFIAPSGPGHASFSTAVPPSVTWASPIPNICALLGHNRLYLLGTSQLCHWFGCLSYTDNFANGCRIANLVDRTPLGIENSPRTHRPESAEVVRLTGCHHNLLRMCADV